MNPPPFSRVVVLGHTGYIGSRLAAALQRGGLDVVGKSIPHIDLTADASVPAITDLLDADAAVVICAAIKKQLGDTPEIFARNIAMTLNVGRALAARPVKRVVYFSSASVYGEDVPHPIISESTPPQPSSFYGIGKHAAERILLKMIGQHPATSLLMIRPALVYGPNEPAYYYGPSGFLRAARARQPITLWGDGEERREFLYIDDVVELTRRLTVGTTTGILNIASGTSYTFAQAIDSIAALLGDPPIVTRRPRSKDKVDHQFDNSTLRALFPGFTFTDLPTGLTRTMRAEESVPQ